jgi:hypothetical protein
MECDENLQNLTSFKHEGDVLKAEVELILMAGAGLLPRSFLSHASGHPAPPSALVFRPDTPPLSTA